MKLGGPVFGWNDPQSWVQAHERWGYRAAYFPSEVPNPDDYAAAAREAGLLIAEVGVWNNPLHADPQKREEAVATCVERLRLADQVGARCCVNIAGSFGDRWEGPDPRDLADGAIEAIAQSVRTILAEAKPQRTTYALETMPFMHPDSAESALALVRAVDRHHFGIHFDPVNMINSPRRFFESGKFVHDFVSKAGPHITAVHLKDIVLEPRLTVHLQEVRPGLGQFDIAELLRVVDGELDAEMPVLLEHLETEEQYRLANEHVREVAARIGISL